MADPLSVAAYLVKKCTDKIKENVNLILKKFADFSDNLQASLSGPFKAALEGDFGPLSEEALAYLEQNADALLVEALGALGVENTVLDALNLFYNMMAQAISMYNDLILLIMKKLALNIIHELEQKEKTNQEIKTKLQDLLDALLKLTSGDPVFEKYLKDLRNSLIQLELGRRDILAVRNTLDRLDRFHGKQFKRGKKRVEAGVNLLKDTADNLTDQVVGNAALADLGIPKLSTGDEVNALLAVPKKAGAVVKAIKDYNERVLKCNALLVAYYAGLEQLQLGIPAILKKYLLQRFDSTLGKLLLLTQSMALVLNGSETATGGPLAGYKAQAIPVSVNAFKWSMDAHLVMQSFKLIPTGHVVGAGGNVSPETKLDRQKNGFARSKNTSSGKVLRGPIADYFEHVEIGQSVEIFNYKAGTYRVKRTYKFQDDDIEETNAQLIADGQPPLTVLENGEIELDRVLNNSIQDINEVEYEITSDALGALQLNFELVDVYRTSVANLKRLGTISNGGATLLASEGQENVAAFMAQLLVFLLEAVNTIVSNSIRPEAIALCRSFIRRCDLVTQRDDEIERLLRVFINTPIPLEDTLNQIQAGLESMLNSLGLGKIADMMKEGKFAEMFGLNSKTATYVGSALAALALLKECFDNDADKAALSEVENEVQGDADLLNFKIPLDFDFAIFKNLQDCIDLNALAGALDAKELICLGLSAIGGESAFNKLDDLLSF